MHGHRSSSPFRHLSTHFQSLVMFPVPFLLSFPIHIASHPRFSSHSSPFLFPPLFSKALNVLLMSSIYLLSISPSLAAFSCLSFLILQLHTRGVHAVCTRVRSCSHVCREKTHISPCSPSCSRPGLFPLIRLLVTPTRSHKRTCRGSKNDVASSTQLPSELNAFPPFFCY